ncbi:translation protein SH3-like domain-containing protein [Echria macrotheca]|uniref:Translation protein SH3-like domain-containing protein n=1 Tax=Echria macrotheca TaxID=438768 RepID=A0AAJ0B9H1_9PEZI|nr:translation protein SH3-like domain-containing protein [Echria macrotheca]
MNVAPLSGRPLACLKTSVRRARQQKAFLCRSMATGSQGRASPSSLPDYNFYQLKDQKTKKLRSAFAVYTPPTVKTNPTTITIVNKPPKPAKRTPEPKLPGLIAPPSDPLPILHASQIARMDPTGARTALFAKTKQGVRVGDVLMVTHRRGGEPFAGVCISIRRAGIDTAILLRNHLSKVGVEMWFKVYNKNVAGIEIIKRARRRARRARLTYLRKPKHDVGSVSDLVFAWKKTRKVFNTKSSPASSKTAKGAKAAKKK